jgi:hypothetical protein
MIGSWTTRFPTLFPEIDILNTLDEILPFRSEREHPEMVCEKPPAGRAATSSSVRSGSHRQSAREIGLAENLQAPGPQDRAGLLVVIDVKHKSRSAVGVNDRRI